MNAGGCATIAPFHNTQEYKRNVDRSVREIEREKTKLQQQVVMSPHDSYTTLVLNSQNLKRNRPLRDARFLHFPTVASQQLQGIPEL